MKLIRFSVVLALASLLSACYTAEHFAGKASDYDDLFFAPAKSAPQRPMLRDSIWRNYAVFGLVPWKQSQIRFAGDRLAMVGAERRPTDMYVRTEMSFLNGLAQFGLGTITYTLSYRLFIPRTTEVSAWEHK